MFPDRITTTFLAVCVIVFVFFATLPSVGDELDPSLKQTYEGKVFVIRSFWPGSLLKFDTAGQLKGDANPGIWTLDGFIRIEKIEMDGSTLRLQCKRLVIGETKDGFDYKNRHKDAHLEIDLDLDPNQSSQATIAAAFARVFVSDKIGFRDSVPRYWRVCITTAITGTEKKRTEGCRFSPRLASIIGVQTGAEPATTAAQASNSPVPATATQETIDGEQVFAVMKGVSAPKILYAPDPEYTDEASAGGINGTCSLDLVIDRSGQPRVVQIQSPIGYGLDEAAIIAVGSWKFAPGLKDGHPVSVRSVALFSFKYN